MSIKEIRVEVGKQIREHTPRSSRVALTTDVGFQCTNKSVVTWLDTWKVALSYHTVLFKTISITIYLLNFSSRNLLSPVWVIFWMNVLWDILLHWQSCGWCFEISHRLVFRPWRHWTGQSEDHPLQNQWFILLSLVWEVLETKCLSPGNFLNIFST